MFTATASLAVDCYRDATAGSLSDSAVLSALTILLLVSDVLMVDTGIRNYVDVSESQMKVRTGVFSGTLEIADIRSVRATHNPLASLALSLDRLLIRYGTYDETMISVKDKEGLFAALSKINPHIEIERSVTNKIWE